MHAILNIKTDDCRHAVYVARPSPLGNPYAIGLDGNRNEVIARYRDWLTARIAERDPVVCTALLGIRLGQSLSCHCAPLPCHAEAIAEVLDEGVQDRLRDHGAKTRRFAGIGSRSTPENVLQVMRKVAHRLAELGYTLLSGGSDGADSAFEEGCRQSACASEADKQGCFGKKEIYLPWPGFRHLQGRHCVTLPSAEAYRVNNCCHEHGTL